MIRVEEKRRRIEASFLDDLFKDLSKSMLNGLLERLESGARQLVGWSLRRLALSIIAIGLIITAAVLLLIAGVQGLKEVSVPPSLAYLAAGIVGLIAGLVLIPRRPSS